METRDFNPPYLPFKTLTNLFDRLADQGIPNRIDRTYLSYLAGITQTYLLAALRTLDLIDGEDRPTEKLIAFVNNPDQRKQMMGDLVRTYYTAPLTLGDGATPGELDDVFKDAYGAQGDTRRKAITFFLNAASYGDVPLSPHYKMPRSSGSAGNGNSAATKPRRRRTATRRERTTPPTGSTTPSLDSLRTKYVEMLMQKAEATDELDFDLLDRIETLLGFEPEREDEQEPHE